MLSSRDQHAFFHQTGGVADARHIPTDSLHLKAVQIRTTEYDAGARWRWQNSHGNGCATVKSDAVALHGSADCLLGGQERFLGEWTDYSAAWKIVCG